MFDGRLGCVVVIVDKFQSSFARMACNIVVVGVQTGLLLGASLATFARAHMLLVVEVPVLIFVEVRLHFTGVCDRK